ncbi:MAG TPA: glycosyltransferase family 2 protein, partial [Acidimicrobiales bacterium]|nr:glycosyltransferase family 2 protein [Acidimicrobiales bacterium]
MTRRPKVVVLGLMSRMPVAGAVWQTLHYLLGLELLGFEAYYVEAHACTPTMLMTHPASDGSTAAAGFISAVMHRFGFDGQWAFHALHHDGRCYGMSERQLSQLYRDAACLLNLHGGTEPLAEHRATGRLVYIETDPVKLQFEIAEAHKPTLDFLDGHCAYFSFAENWGKPDCLLPVTDRYEFRPTRQPVIVDLWAGGETPSSRTYTTIGNWNQNSRDITVDGQVYSWSKRQQFLKFLDIPRRSGRLFELALSKPADDQSVLEAHDWSVRPAAEVSSDIDRYRTYIRSSRGEFTVAKEQNVAFRSGWFSDRSVTYLASGRPVITQDTGLAGVLPLGEGLFAYSTADEAISALEAIDAAYLRHCRAAEEVARTHFDHEAVLTGMLSAVGLTTAKVTGRDRDAILNPRQAFAPLYPSLPVDLVLKPVRKHPLTLEADTVERLLAAEVPAPNAPHPEVPAKVSIVVVTFDQLPLTRLCLESTLLNTSCPLYELIVVDNGSSEDTISYLQELAEANPGTVRLILNDGNEGFPRGVNRGLATAKGETLVILNNDTIVAPGWLAGLLAHLEDPTVGMVGPVTNDAGNECRIPAEYRTYGEFLSFCGRRPRDGAAREVEMLTMFCVALPRRVYETVGALDDGYGMGLFEDDDYAIRLRRAGYRTVCAEDVFVHHFGRASFGSLVPTGEYAALFENNRARFEAKWDVQWVPHAAPLDAAYDKLVERVRSVVVSTVPTEALVAIASRGDQRLVEI